MTVSPDNSPANNTGGCRLAPESLNSTMSCDPATPSIETLSEIGHSAAADGPPLTDMLRCSKPTAVAEDSADDGTTVARDLVTGTDDATEENANIDSRFPESRALSASQNDCLVLNKLPAELRNEIYELAFTVDDDEVEIDLSDFGPPRSPPLLTKGEVELSKARPPNNALLSTCHQIQSEATQLYKRASHKYWTDTHFFIDDLKPNGFDAAPEIESLKQDLWGGQNPRLKSENIDRIRHVGIFHRSVRDRNSLEVFTYMSESGIWLREWFHGVRAEPLLSTYVVLRVSDSRMRPLQRDWEIEDQKLYAEKIAQESNYKHAFHVELGSKLVHNYNYY
ncbi:hypothetical protein CB0940_11968 [Cercospora beticola]|uniref:F-box domain-containing protein n=1 Tax=Cercospora beticola TaxID=122368 RepID=A0A2G5IDJ4_CERBT|nr:hypothetical protein CB0940_11968 [Cercospora beticola]PIB02820.1 hypothetical protein CB0940_11968 [Cercospora beticola]WPB04342.1 hypothetical protein RHO25_008988 [Cercospora beticola]CAK1356838.1 unnamed protein product [Cercospora beticola]